MVEAVCLNENVLPWYIFLPENLKHQPSGYLFGYVENQSSSKAIYVLSVLLDGDDSDGKKGWAPNCVGYWCGRGGDFSQKPDRKIALLLNYKTSVGWNCQLKLQQDTDVTVSTICVLYHPDDFLSSCILPSQKVMSMPEKYTNHKSSNARVEDNCDEDDKTFKLSKPRAKHLSPIDMAIQLVWRKRHEKLLPNEKSFCTQPSRTRISVMWTTLVSMLLSAMFQLFSRFAECIAFSCKPMKNIWVPNLCQLFQLKKQKIAKVQDDKRKPKTSDSETEEAFGESRLIQLLKFNIFTQQVVDTAIGVLFFIHFCNDQQSSSIAHFILDWADNVANELTQLIEWLMGAPAGLKLNAQLSHFLGHFFLFHIQLWKGYLEILRLAFPQLIQCVAWMGLLGFSCQLCIIKDLISMLTLHIYCFYVYAARIFNVQVYALRSLWRLFCGKKWNVLRCREDSVLYNRDQLFLGTLLFTILLFLLPTTTLFYTVFTVLRVLIDTVQGLLSRLITLLTVTPIYTFLLRLLAPRHVSGQVELELMQALEGSSNTVLQMKVSPLSLSSLMEITRPFLHSQPESTYTWGQFGSNLFTGRLIYPWTTLGTKSKVS